jgi:galacturan 1,4-alpha-galacturonidase
MKTINIAYIGGGSRQWARGLMSDLALEEGLGGEVRLFDINHHAAKNNVVIGNKMQASDDAKSAFTYVYSATIDDALKGADFVVISILPGTFEDMKVYAHDPEAYGIYQSVADTTGPAGVMRGLMAIPMFVGFGEKIKEHCPNAWVINFTNPMTLCVQALHEGFPDIKAYGNCHEVFGSQSDLSRIYNKHVGEDKAKREDVQITVSGINHFTWITKMSCLGTDLAPLYDAHVKDNLDPSKEDDPGRYKKNAPFGSASKIKYDLYDKFQCMAAAGDRHLAEFMPLSYYLESEERRDLFKFNLTPVQWRIDNLRRAEEKTERLVSGEETVRPYRSGEEGIRQIRALLGHEILLTNVNSLNRGQAEDLPLGQVVETNALFRYDKLQPVQSGTLPKAVRSMVIRHMDNHHLVMESYRKKDLNLAVQALANDPLCAHMDYPAVRDMFDGMAEKLAPYLEHYGKRT